MGINVCVAIEYNCDKPYEVMESVINECALEGIQVISIDLIGSRAVFKLWSTGVLHEFDMEDGQLLILKDGCFSVVSPSFRSFKPELNKRRLLGNNVKSKGD